ncbi:ephrin domain-containing protein [Ditylenchus destructor]|uniref:Ephrin domain-containing protein n=1 Tax=Ditylenchus destructor TaxID=166010 RepID=A0AAD4NFX1_9BILA|nr:ephrin domain-containing protein [Ditylenchus destructor]
MNYSFTSLFQYAIWIANTFLYLFFAINNGAEAKKLEDIYWNSSNPMFDISNTDHVKQVRLLDRVTILCPQPVPEKPYEYSKLYVVTREGYDKCELRDEKQLGVCTTPERQSSISVVFRDFSPLPSAFEFQAGESYYVITTSDGTFEGLNTTSGGLCLLKNMKMKFDVSQSNSRNSRIRPTVTANSPGAINTLRTNSSASPIMYIIHTSEPESAAISDSSAVVSEERSSGEIGDDADSALCDSPNKFMLILALLLAYMTYQRTAAR